MAQNNQIHTQAIQSSKIKVFPAFVSLFVLLSAATFGLVHHYVDAASSYGGSTCNIAFPAGSSAADGIVKPGETFKADFSVYNNTPVISGSSQDLWWSNSAGPGGQIHSGRYKLVASTGGSDYDYRWGGSVGNPAIAEIYGGGLVFGTYYAIGNVNGSDNRTGVGYGNYTAPSAEGTYPFTFQLKQTGGSWLPITCSKSLRVSNSSGGGGSTPTPVTPTPVTRDPNPYYCNKPYPVLLKSGDTNKTGGRTDQCVTAVQYDLKSASKDLALSGTVDAATVEAIKNFQAFFGGKFASVTGQLTQSQIAGVAEVFGPYKTSTGGTTTPTPPRPPARDPNPYVCNSPYPVIGSGYKDKAAGRNDQCVSAVQYALKAAAPSLSVTGSVNATTVTAFKNFQKFFRFSDTSGTLSAEQVKAIAQIFGAYKTSSGGTTTPTPPPPTQPTGAMLDVALIGTNFPAGTEGKTMFQSVAKSTIAAILAVEPFSSHRSQIAFHLLQVNDVTCTAWSLGSAVLPHCDENKAGADLIAAGVPFEKVIDLNYGTYGGTSGYYQWFATANVSGPGDHGTALHEFGHEMGLLDEYTYAPSQMSKGAGDHGIQNCKEDGYPNKYYTSTDATYPGCTFSVWSRNSPTSIMVAPTETSFNPVSIKIMTETINACVTGTGTCSDPLPPN